MTTPEQRAANIATAKRLIDEHRYFCREIADSLGWESPPPDLKNLCEHYLELVGESKRGAT